MPLVPTTGSEASKPGAKLTASSRSRSRRSPPNRRTMRPRASHSATAMPTSASEAVSVRSTGSAARRSRSSIRTSGA